MTLDALAHLGHGWIVKPAILLVAACATPAASPAPIAWSSPVEIAKGGGERGPWQQNDSRYDHVDDPTVALVAGAAAVAWVDHRTKDVHFQIYEADGRARFARAANVSRTPAVFSWLPRIVVAGRDVHVLWQEIVFSGGTHGGEIFFARSRDGGATFEPPMNLSRSTNGDGKARLDAKTWHNGSLDLARADDGTLHAAWTEYDGPLWVSRSADHGATFTPPMRVGGTTERPARAPALATRGRAVYLAWTLGEDRAADIHVARSTDGGRTFAEPAIAARTPGYSEAPKLAVDRAGTLHLVHAEGAGDWRTAAAVHYLRSRDDGKTFTRATVLSREPNAGFPALSVDGDQVYVLWERSASAGEMARGLALTYSRDGGATFATPALVDGSADAGWNGSHQGRLMRKLAVDAGAIAVVNSALAHGTSSRVWLVRGRLSAR